MLSATTQKRACNLEKSNRPRRFASNKSRSIRALSLLLTITAILLAQQSSFNYSEAEVPSYTLPDPLVAEDGTRIATADSWRAKRRSEIIRLFERHVYGAVPPGAPKNLTAEVVEPATPALSGKAIRKQIRIAFAEGTDAPAMEILLYLPVNASRPVPVFLGLNFYGNHTIHADPGIHLSKNWISGDRRYGIINNRATDGARGLRAEQWPVEMILSRGYGLATAYCGDMDPDFDDGFQNGVHPLGYRNGQTNPAADEWGSISAWAWGLSRAQDYLETDEDVDHTRVAVMGHSRLGKAALWAGARDERFALVIANESGCGGAALSRRSFGETVESINSQFPHWFADAFKRYNSNEFALPVDQHELIALVAPRLVYIASARQDLWADPTGEFLSAVHAGPVYRLFGKRDLENDRRPPANSPIHHDIGYHIRSGKHDITEYDWTQWMEFRDKHLHSDTASTRPGLYTGR